MRLYGVDFEVTNTQLILCGILVTIAWIGVGVLIGRAIWGG